MEIALYEPNAGFYEHAGVAGRRGDFITSPEIGPLFGVVVARVLDNFWEKLGKPDPFFVFDVGAGPGTLANSVLRANAHCATALRYVLVERSTAQRSLHNKYLVLEDRTEIFGSIDYDDDDLQVISSQGPLVTSMAELPAVRVDGVVLANELFDNIPFDIAEFHEQSWQETSVTNHSENIAWSYGPLAETDADWLQTAIDNPVEGMRVPLFRNAQLQLQAFFDVLETGFVLAFDYGAKTTTELGERSPHWLRTYREHDRGHDPFQQIGDRDITTDVAFDQLARKKKPNLLTAQSEFLQQLGINDLVQEGKQIWQERAAIGDLQALQARSRINEAEALLDPNSLGAFLVATWEI